MAAEQCCLQEISIGSSRSSVFIQPLNLCGRLFLLGAGHVAREVAWLADRTEFQVIIVDPRQELMQPEFSPQPALSAQKNLIIFFPGTLSVHEIFWSLPGLTTPRIWLSLNRRQPLRHAILAR